MVPIFAQTAVRTRMHQLKYLNFSHTSYRIICESKHRRSLIVFVIMRDSRARAGSAAFVLMTDARLDVLAVFDPITRQKVRQQVIALVLATNLSDHDYFMGAWSSASMSVQQFVAIHPIDRIATVLTSAR
jgi:hypothetical protein